MKWFHHECAARHDPKLQILGATHGAEGLGIYWGLLEEIGQHSDTFHLKIVGHDEDAERRFGQLLANRDPNPMFPTWGTQESPHPNPMFPTWGTREIPRLPLKLLAKNLFTSVKKLDAIITFCVDTGLFDARKWTEFNVLYSPSFEHRADDYTRRTKRAHVLSGGEGSNIVRTESEHPSDNVRTISEHTTNTIRTSCALHDHEGSGPATDNVLLRTDKEEKNKNRTEKKMQLTNTATVNKSRPTAPAKLAADVIRESDPDISGYLIDPSEELFDEYSLRFHFHLQSWNKEHPSHVVEWHPTTAELKKLFYGGTHEHKLSMCFHAYKPLGEKINYPELVLRALQLLLTTNARGKIANPFGWMWTCLHGNGQRTKPWAQLLTAEEENVTSKKGIQ